MYLTADIGASNTRVASSKNLKSFCKIEKFETKRDFSNQVEILNSVLEDLSEGKKVKSICVGIASVLDHENRKFLKTVNYDVMDRKGFEDLVDDRFSDVSLFVENDATLAGLGEAVFGAGKDADVVAYLTLSTGVGGVRVEKKGNSVEYFPSEPGHHVILEDGRLCPKSDIFGSLESYCSGTSFEEIFGVKPEKCDDKEAWDIYAKHLSTGIINVIAFWNPKTIILGGGVSNRFDRFFDPLMKYLNKQDFFKIPEIKKCELGDESGLYGGLVLLKNCL